MLPVKSFFQRSSLVGKDPIQYERGDTRYLLALPPAQSGNLGFVCTCTVYQTHDSLITFNNGVRIPQDKIRRGILGRKLDKRKEEVLGGNLF